VSDLALMRFARLISVIDVAVVGVAVVAIALPPRSMEAAVPSRLKGDSQVRGALMEARSIVTPKDAIIAAESSQLLSDAGFRDWAVELPRALSQREKDLPTRWQALRAVSVAYLERFEVSHALDYINRAISACDSAGVDACPSWDAVRMDLFARHIDAGLKSGIDPHKDPEGFNAAAADSVRHIRLTPKAGMGGPTPAPVAPAPVAPTPVP
jgi:hypothetical protein